MADTSSVNTLPWTCLLLLMLYLTLWAFHLVTEFLFLAYIILVWFVSQSPCFSWLFYPRPWLSYSCQPAIYFFISWSYLKCSLSMVVCLHFLDELFPSEARTAAFCCCLRKEFEDNQSCLIVGLLQALFCSHSGAAHLAAMFLCLVTRL